MKQYDLDWSGSSSGGFFDGIPKNLHLSNKCDKCYSFSSEIHQTTRSMGIVEKILVGLNISKPKTIKVCQDCYRDEQIKKLID